MKLPDWLYPVVCDTATGSLSYDNYSGNWGRHSVSASYDATELFYSETASSLQGGTPRLVYSLAQSRIGETPLYYSFNSEYVSMARIDTDGDREIDQGLNRFDVNPTLRVPSTSCRT